MEIRNIAIIAHVDHGKTTLTDALLRQTGMIKNQEQTMDSFILEKERGITIYAKNTSIIYKNSKINIVDTPGHADFSSEVERVLRSIDSVILVVDAQEGPMPQTKFVLKKSLELGLHPLVVINKIDKPAARVPYVEEKIFELFLDLNANEEQLKFPICYTIAKQGIAKLKPDDTSTDLTPLLDLIMEKVKPAESDLNKPFRLQPFNLAYDNYLGRMAIGRIYEGILNQGEKVLVKSLQKESQAATISKIYTFSGFERQEVKQAQAGDIVMIAGIADIDIGDTICATQDQELLPSITIDPPTISMDFLVNDSPFAGRDGKLVTSRQIKERLEKELEVNVGLKIDFTSPLYWRVFGRGELHLAILLENMRREGYEIQVSQPKVIILQENGQTLEPFEEVIIDLPEKYSGKTIESLAKRRGILQEMKPENNQTRLVFEIPTRGLIGYRGQFILDTHGEGIMCSRVIGFKPHAGDIDKRDVGSMISMITGKSASYALYNLQDRGQLYIGPNVEVYEGMVIGNTSKGRDMTVNPVKGKHLTNMRASTSDEGIILTPPLKLTLERYLEIMTDDEYLEITPSYLRLRKKYLTQDERVKFSHKE